MSINYAALDSEQGEVRVLELLPGSGDDICRCKLHHLKLFDDDRRPYETISYCWGDPYDRAYVVIDSTKVDVPASSEQALRKVRLSDRPRCVWIDSICIDQRSLSEREAQIALMGDIYRGGTANLIDLGPGFDGLKSALHITQSLSEQLNTMAVEAGEDYIPQLMKSYGRSSWTKPSPAVVNELALLKLYNLPWFTYANDLHTMADAF